jgi:hypothetical protein
LGFDLATGASRGLFFFVGTLFAERDQVFYFYFTSDLTPPTLLTVCVLAKRLPSASTLLRYPETNYYTALSVYSDARDENLKGSLEVETLVERGRVSRVRVDLVDSGKAN